MTGPLLSRISWRIWDILYTAGEPLTTAQVAARVGIASIAKASANLCSMSRAGQAVAHGEKPHRTWTAGREPAAVRRPKRPSKWTRVRTETLTRALAGDLGAIQDLRRALEREERKL